MITEIQKETEKIYEKQTWVRKSFQDIIDVLNGQISLKQEGSVGFAITTNVNKAFESIYCLRYKNGHFSIVTDDSWKETYTDVNIESIEPSDCRKIIKELPSLLEKVLQKLKSINAEYEGIEEIVNVFLKNREGK